MPHIAVVGAGIAALHLGLFLQKHGIDVTLYTDRSAADLRSGRLINSVGLQAATRDRDRALGTNHWDAPENDVHLLQVHIAAEQPLAFQGPWDGATIGIDMRLYLPHLLEDFAARGGRIVVGAIDAAGLAGLARDHELVVVASGRAGLAELFPRIPERSPHQEPQRRLSVVLVDGVQRLEPRRVSFQVIPGQGEIFDFPFLTNHGVPHAIVIEALPGSAMEPFTRLRYEDDPAGYEKALLAYLQEYAPLMRERIDPAQFGVTHPLDTLLGAVTPTVRQGYRALDHGRFALALGDAQVSYDPITAQGANMASRAAWVLGSAIVDHARAGRALDQAFCADAEQRMWEAHQAASQWTNAALMPPPPHMFALFMAAASNPAVAKAFVGNFNTPERQWAALSSPEGMDAFLASVA